MPFSCDRCLMQSERRISEQFEHPVVRELEDPSLDDVYLIAPEGVLEMCIRDRSDAWSGAKSF